jgi:hypothetical protein
MVQDTKGGKRHYTNAMAVVAIVIDGEQWNQMFDESLDSAAVRAIVSDVSMKVHEKSRHWRLGFCMESLRNISNHLKISVPCLTSGRKSMMLFLK